MVEIAGKQIRVATCKDGLYKVSHNDLEELGQEWNKEEYRYAGTNPNNYVRFNNEIWRIIGLVNVKVKDNIEQRVKIVRTDGIGNQKDFGSYAWDRASEDTSYTNNWTKSKLKDMLNGIYYESGTGECWTGELGTTSYQSTCDFTGEGDQVKGLNEVAQNMIDKEVIWNTGAYDEPNITVNQFYEKERGTESSDNNRNPAEWSSETDVGEKHNGIGLIYPSDFGYATNGGSIGRETCFAKDLYNWYSEDGNYKSECGGKDWLKPKIDHSWVLFSKKLSPFNTYSIGFNGDINLDHRVDLVRKVWPTAYITTSSTITSGEGTLEVPYELQLNA